MDLSAIKNIYAYQDGDTITPGMGVQIEEGFGLTQYYDPNTGKVSQTDFSQHPATLFPQPYSSKQGKIIVPETTGQQWYYNNISDNAGILDANGNVKEAYKNLFETTTVVMNGSTFPALKIKGNLVSAENKDFTDKYIYYVSSYKGLQITCQKMIAVQAAVGDAYSILLSVVGQDGASDNVLSNDNDWVQYTAYLQLAGSTIKDAVISFERMKGDAWQTVANAASLTEVDGGKLKIYQAAVEGVDIFRAVAKYAGKTYYMPFEVTDIHDPYYIVDGCSIMGDTIAEGEKATFNPKVYSRADGTEQSGWTFDFSILTASSGEVVDAFDETALTYANITGVGGISVRITATKS
ncbi:MAG: hypothetical protein IKK81_07350 [Prevotella sp.]|nr:hypothetical protein [Prevotella sp.]